MIKVYFACDWGESTESYTGKVNKLTPGNKGIWKGIVSVLKIEEADYIICLNNVPRNILRRYSKKIIVFPREPRVLCNHVSGEKNWFTYDTIHHVVTYPQFINKNYDELKSLKYTDLVKNKILSSVTSYKLHTKCAKKRVEFIKKFIDKYPENLDIYGMGWPGNTSGYKGNLGKYHNQDVVGTSKFDGLKNYHYSLCLENSSEKNYFTEKFTDSILSWSVPIYFGCNNIEEYFPQDSYYKIDIFNENCLDKVKEIISTPVTEKNIKALEGARELILEKYNIWGVIEKIV